MKNYMVLCAGLCAAFALTSCGSMKSSESAYRKAYEKAKAQDSQMAAEEPIVTETPIVTPLETKPASEANVTTIRAYNGNETNNNSSNNTASTSSSKTSSANYNSYNKNSRAENATYREESLTVVSGDGLKEFNVVVGSFSLKANAEGLQSTLKSQGYNAQIAYNADRNMYRVIAATHTDKYDAVKSRNELRAGKYPDAWLLFKK